MSRFYILGDSGYDQKIHSNIPAAATAIPEDQEAQFIARPSRYHTWANGAWSIDATKRDELAGIIKTMINAKTKQTIISGFVYQGQRIELSLENQNNYKAEHDLREIFTYPHKIKTMDGYYNIADAAEYHLFYLAGVSFIRQTNEQGWQQKDAVDQMTAAELIDRLNQLITEGATEDGN